MQHHRDRDIVPGNGGELIWGFGNVRIVEARFQQAFEVVFLGLIG